MDIIKIGKHVIEIDLNRTRMAYANIDFENNRCDCEGCNNYCEYADKFEDELKSFFKQLGIDDMKSYAELLMYYKDEEKNIGYYNGWFHVYGKILEGPDMWDDYLPRQERLDKVTDNFNIGFSKTLSQVKKGFKEDACIQIEFFAKIPWIID